MLVLSTSPGQKLVIPAGNITLTVLEVRGERVRLGISVPADTPGHLLEIWRHPQTASAPAKAPTQAV